jgi:hypothetical protein
VLAQVSGYRNYLQVLPEDGERIQLQNIILKNKEGGVFYTKTGRWIMSENIIFVLVYYSHKFLDLATEPLRSKSLYNIFSEDSLGVSVMNRIRLCQVYVTHVYHRSTWFYPGSGQYNESDNLE